MAAIETVDLVKHFRQGESIVKAVDGISIAVPPAQFVALIGRSGSGKTTFLDCTGLLLKPTSGRVLIDGEDAGLLPERRKAELRAKRLGFVFQEYNLLPHLTALENVMLPLRFAGGDRAAGRRRALQLLQDVGLGGRASHRPHQLSGGEQQRVAIARSLVNQPAVVLGDEITGAVDTKTSQELCDVLLHLRAEYGTTFIVVTHDMDVAKRADRLVRLSDGRVVSDEVLPPKPQVSAA